VSDTLPKFDDPPVVETVVGVQFEPLPGYTTAHAGRFWMEYLNEGWPNTIEANRILEQFEHFGKDVWWEPKQIRLSQEQPSPRIQFVSQNEERMIQIQNTRFHYNWRKRERLYPRYDDSIRSFEETWANFQEYCVNSGIHNPKLNQWEITYINHIPNGELWSCVSDWNNVFPDLWIPAVRIEELSPEGIDSNWRLNIGHRQGRLHISLEHIKIGGAKGPEAIRLVLTARGPIGNESETNLRLGLDLGHSTIVRAFTDMTSDTAHKSWKRRR
jgi:uncharacterized protein (TIGR04255 family)